MTFVFKPAVLSGETLFELPRPVTSLRLQDAWDFEQFKVPLADGDEVAGHSRQGVDVFLEGQIGTRAGALKPGEAEMFAEIENLRSALHVGAPDEKYTLFLYHDSGTSTYRHLKSCSTVRLEYDLSDKHLFTYSAVIHAEDPVVYTEAV